MNDFYQNQKPFWNFINKSKSCGTPIPALKNGSNFVASDASLFIDCFVSDFTNVFM